MTRNAEPDARKSHRSARAEIAVGAVVQLVVGFGICLVLSLDIHWGIAGAVFLFPLFWAVERDRRSETPLGWTIAGSASLVLGLSVGVSVFDVSRSDAFGFTGILLAAAWMIVWFADRLGHRQPE